MADLQKMFFIRNFVWLAACFFALSQTAWGATVQAVLDRDQISMGESATLQIVVQNGEAKSNPGVTQIPGLAIRAGGTSQQFSVVNGLRTDSLIFNYSITPAKEGVFTIPPIKIRTESGVESTAPLTLTVTKGEDANASGKLAFARLTLSKKEVYVGEVVPGEIQFFVIEGRNLQGPQIKGDGFVVNKILPAMKTQTRLNNVVYNVLVYKIAVSASKAGRIEFGPAEFNLELIVRQNGRRAANDVFAEFFGGGAQVQEATILSDSVTVNVLPLPTPTPDGFLGAVGNFSMQVKASPTEITAGDPITLKIDLRGKGSLDALALPNLNWDNFKTYPATGTIQTSDALGLEGIKSFEQVVIPENAAAREIPPLLFNYFDPEQRRYVALTNPATALKIKASAAPLAQATVAPAKNEEDREASAVDLIHIKPDPGQFRSRQPTLVEQPWFWAANTLPCLAWLSIMGWRRQRERQQNDPRWQRRRQSLEKIRLGLIEIRQAARQGDAVRFYTLAFRLLQEQLGERLDLPASAVTETVIDDHVAQLGIDPALQTELRDLFHQCNLARYAGATTDASLEITLNRLEKTLTQTQRAVSTAPRAALVRIVLPWALLGMTANAIGADNELARRFAEANRSYEQGKFAEAFRQYQLIATNQVSPALLFNLGNAAWKSDHPGLAILHLAQAAQLAPHDADIKANLRFIRERVTRPKPTLGETIASAFSLEEAALIFFSSNLLLFGILIWRGFSPVGRGFAPLTISATLFGAAAILLVINLSVRESRVVITVKEASAKFGPVSESQTAFNLRDGTELMLVDRRDEWLQIADAGKRIGWVRTGDAAILP